MARNPDPKPRGWSELIAAVESLEARVAAEAEDADARYKLAVLLLEVHVWTRERPELSRARDVLKQAVKKRPGHAPSHAVLGHVYDQGGARGAKQALACMSEAHRLDPREKIYEVYWMTLLSESGQEKAALAAIRAAAPRHGPDLKKLLRELAKARFKADSTSLLMNGFLRARNFLRSRLGDEAERIQNRLRPGRAQREAAAQHGRCLQDQRELERSFDPSRVPASLRALSSLASRYGIGDDYCRPHLLQRLQKKQRAQLVRAVGRLATPLHAWLDTFPEGKMPVEAAALMYLALGAEEIRTARRQK
jgi:hypothetical protein